ncbi:MAG: ANTAR domain-containing protein [Oscillibacter sp.]|nr:ANTAR domain-containing protein [Oscillibacter sp.]MBR1689921.1 ANTAR domain-containing protein [Oscillibacter sp.]
MDRLVVAFSSDEAQRRIRRLLESEGYSPFLCCAAGAEAVRAVRKMGSGTVICGSRLRDMTANQLAADLLGQAVVLVVAAAERLDLCEGENLYKLASPATRSDFFSVLELTRQVEERRLRRPPPRRDASEQRLIREAKALLMSVNRMSEAEAHRFLQRASMNSGLKLAEAAQTIIQTYTRR